MVENKVKPTDKHKLIYVIAGKEAVLVGAECERLLEQFLEPEQRVTGLFSAEATKVSGIEVLDELRTLPFLTPRRVVLVRGAESFISTNRELLETYFDNPCPTGILIFTVNSWDARTRLAKKLPKNGKLISIAAPKPWLLAGRLVEYAAQAHDKRIPKTAAQVLVELVGDDLTRLYSEIDKLALFVDKAETITLRDIESLTGRNRLFNAFGIIDSVVKGNIAEAIERLRNMFAADRSAEYTVVGAFAFHFRRMFNAKALLEKGLNPGQVAGKLGIWGNKEAFFAHLRKMTLRQIALVLLKLGEIDYAIKTGRTKADAAIERLVLSLAG